MLRPGTEETARATGPAPAMRSARAASRETSPSSVRATSKFSESSPSRKAMPKRNSKPVTEIAETSKAPLGRSPPNREVQRPGGKEVGQQTAQYRPNA